MNRFVIAIACATMSGVGGLALAQAPPPDTQPPPPTAPPSDYQQAPTPSNTTTSSDKHALMKQCMAQQEQNQANSGMSKKDMKKYCKNQVKNPPQQ